MSTNTTLVELSDHLANAVETAGRSTVMINARRRLPATGLVWSADGLIVTASHVVERDEDILIGLPDGVEVEAEFIGRDQSTDIAVLRARAGGLIPITKATTTTRAGHLALALGKPGNSEPLATLGIVSAVGDTLRTRMGGSIERPVYTDLTLYPGFSGGPLVNTGGEVIGMNTSGLSRGLPVTIPHEVIERISATLLEHGRIARGYIGVAVQPVELPAAITGQITTGQSIGMLITGIEPDSPADGAGLMLGDILLTFSGQPVDTVEALQNLLASGTAGTEQELQIARAGSVQLVRVGVGSR